MPAAFRHENMTSSLLPSTMFCPVSKSSFYLWWHGSVAGIVGVALLVE